MMVVLNLANQFGDKGESFQSTSFRLVSCKPTKHAGRWLVLIFWPWKSAKEE